MEYSSSLVVFSLSPFLIQLLNILNIVTSFGFLAPFLCVYEFMYACSPVWVQVHGMPKVYVKYLDWFPAYIMRKGLCLNPENSKPINLVSHPGPGILSASLECWDYNLTTIPAWDLCWFWRLKFYSPRLCDKYFTHQRAPSLYLPFFLSQNYALFVKFSNILGFKTISVPVLLLLLELWVS